MVRVTGRSAATGSRARLARINRILHQQFDDPSDVSRVVWMPSHRAEHEVGVVTRSDGTPLTSIDREANDLADKLAKNAARKHRVPAEIRARLAADDAHAESIAIILARLTHAANNATVAPKRDSAPSDGLGAWRRSRPGAPSRSRTAAHRPPALGGHLLTRVSGEWRCGACRARSARWNWIAPKRCGGSAAAQWAERAAALAAAAGHEGRGHRRYAYGTLVWCDRCGAYADRFAVGLARPCPGRPLYASRAAQLRRLQRGRHPLTGSPFHDAAVAEHHCVDGDSASYPIGGAHGGAPEQWGSASGSASVTSRQPPTRRRVHDLTLNRRFDEHPAAAERQRPAQPSVQTTATDRLAALRRRLREKWGEEQRVTAREEPDPPLPPALPVGSVTRRADAGDAVTVAQHGAAAEASHQSIPPRTRAVEQAEEDDFRGSKRRRLLAVLAAPAQSSLSSYLPSYTTRASNVTRPDARNVTQMLMSDSNGGIMNDNENAHAQRESKKQRFM